MAGYELVYSRVVSDALMSCPEYASNFTDIRVTFSSTSHYPESDQGNSELDHVTILKFATAKRASLGR